MDKQDESYLDSLLDSFSKESSNLREKKPAVVKNNRTKKKTEDDSGEILDHALVFDTLLSEDTDESLDLESLATDLDSMATDLEEFDLEFDMSQDPFTEDTFFSEDEELSFDELDLSDFSLDEEATLSENAPERKMSQDALADVSDEAIPSETFAESISEPISEPLPGAIEETEEAENAESEEAEHVVQLEASEQDILDLLHQVDDDNQPEEILTDDELASDEIMTEDMDLYDNAGMSEDIVMPENIGMPEDIGVLGDTGMSDEIDVSDILGSDSFESLDGIGELGLDSMDLSGSMMGELGMDTPEEQDNEIGIEEINLGEIDMETIGLGELGFSDFSLDEEEEVSSPEPKKKKGKNKKQEKQGQDTETDEDSSFIKRLFHKLFDNIPVETKSTEEGNEFLPEEVAAEQAAMAEEEKARSKEEKAAQKKELAEAKKKEKEEAKKAQDAKKKEKAEEKAAQKAAKLQEKKMKEAAEPVDNGRINRAGALVVFSFFAIVAVVIIFGSRSSAYVLSIQNASREFSLQHYNEAYEEIRGLEVKAQDMVLRDKIMTVMYVNKQLNSYNNFFANQDYPKALHSLLKGLLRYDKYITLAKELGIQSDLDYVRGQILAELERVYSLSERDALNMLELKDDMEYTTKVYEAASRVEPPEEVEYVP